ncbi:hypothetical protein JM16_003837 [Phytophthora kernoviae]|uniref:Uncharacterized protein n=1 Tax=Phytophthora kernoviae TaxID=325452 RepID=A0A8T0M0T7_9STRA|nr:hypothetical protein JM16_003837 [Phytophthora kernoviae]
MSSSSYAAWAKFDVEKELERVDETEHREDQEKQQLKQVHAKENVETSAFQAAQQSADVLAAQAAVAALKAKKRKKKEPGETLPKANDLLAIVKMFYKDVYLGIGTCDLEEGRLAAASEAFKEVLVRDDVHLAAWIKRGEAFERMDAPLLAMLHFNRVVSLDSDHESGKEALERVKAKLLTKGDSSFGTIRLLP